MQNYSIKQFKEELQYLGLEEDFAREEQEELYDQVSGYPRPEREMMMMDYAVAQRMP
jgi:hypothetical protein